MAATEMQSTRAMADGLEPHPGRGVRRAALAVGAIAAMALPGFALGAEWEFTPRVTVGETWTDNVTLAGSGLEESEWITELKPGFSLATAGPRTTLQLDYDLQALWFADNSDFNDVYHNAVGTANFTLLPQTLYLDAFTRYDQQNIDPRGSIARSNVFETGNRTDSLVYGVSPYHVGRWGAWGESLVRLQYQAVTYLNTDEGIGTLQDSDTQSISAQLGSPQERRGFSWRAYGSSAKTEFDVSPEYEYAQVGLDLGMPVGLRTRATASGGRESDIAVDTSAGGLDATFWYVGFEWEPSDLQSLSAQVGERFYGTAWEVHWIRRGSRGQLSLDYTEDPTTSSGVLGGDGMFQPGLTPGGTPALDTRVFLRKRASGRASYEFVRSRLEAIIHAEKRIYQDAESGDERSSGARLNYDWDLAARTTLGASVDFERTSYEVTGDNEYLQFSVNVNRQLTRTLSGELRLGNLRRDQDVGTDYTANWISVYLTAEF